MSFQPPPRGSKAVVSLRQQLVQTLSELVRNGDRERAQHIFNTGLQLAGFHGLAPGPVPLTWPVRHEWLERALESYVSGDTLYFLQRLVPQDQQRLLYVTPDFRFSGWRLNWLVDQEQEGDSPAADRLLLSERQLDQLRAAGWLGPSGPDWLTTPGEDARAVSLRQELAAWLDKHPVQEPAAGDDTGGKSKKPKVVVPLWQPPEFADPGVFFDPSSGSDQVFLLAADVLQSAMLNPLGPEAQLLELVRLQVFKVLVLDSTLARLAVKLEDQCQLELPQLEKAFAMLSHVFRVCSLVSSPARLQAEAEFETTGYEPGTDLLMTFLAHRASGVITADRQLLETGLSGAAVFDPADLYEYFFQDGDDDGNA